MKFVFSNPGFPGPPWWLFVLGGIVWLGVLYRILTRADFSSTDKLLWAVVVIFVPVFGVVLFWVAAPAAGSSVPKRAIVRGSDVSGTPWAADPNHTA